MKFPAELPSPANDIANAIIEKESGDKLLEWGAKLFYFDKRKCIQIVNFASKFTLFLFDIKVADLKNIGGLIANYMLELYKDDIKMCKALIKMFEESPLICFAKLTDKSAISTLNTTQSRYAADGYWFYKFMRDGVLHTMEINHNINFEWPFTMKINGKTEYFYASEKFREIVLERYNK